MTRVQEFRRARPKKEKRPAPRRAIPFALVPHGIGESPWPSQSNAPRKDVPASDAGGLLPGGAPLSAGCTTGTELYQLPPAPWAQTAAKNATGAGEEGPCRSSGAAGMRVPTAAFRPTVSSF